MVRGKGLRAGATTSPPQQQISPTSLSTTAGLLLAVILSIFAVAPLFYPGYIQTHSGFTLLWNVADLRANLGDLSWTPHIAVHFDPLRSDGLLPFYLAGLLPLAPASAVKLVMGLSWLLGGIGIFLWLKSWLGNSGALVAALVYTYLPHQIATVYVRGAWAETLFWGLLPWALRFMIYDLRFTIYDEAPFGYLRLSPSSKIQNPHSPGHISSEKSKIQNPKSKIQNPMAVLFWLGLGLSQLGLALWALMFVTLLLLVAAGRSQALLSILSAFLGTGLAIAIYLFVLSSPLFGPPSILFADHFLFPFQLVSAFWGFGPSLPGWNDGLSLQLGLAAIGLSMLSLFLWQWGGASRTDRRLIFFSMAALVLILLQFSATSFLWNLPLWPGYTLSRTLTYPWQLLGLIGLCLAVLAGVALWLERQLTHLPLFGAVIVIIVLSVYPYLLPQFIQLDSDLAGSPQAELGDARLALLTYDFSVMTSGHTVGLERGQTAIPLTVHGPLQAGDTLIINVAWQPLQIFSDDFKVFAHLVDSNDNVLAQFDGYPRAGSYPTSQWIPGEVINDAYPISFPADAPPGPYRLFIGLYDEATSARLPVPTDSAGRVILDVQ